jgi:hypothetical protein
MGDDLKTTIENLAKAVQALQAATEANAKAIQALSTDRSSSAGHRQPTGEHHNERPPRFQKMDFPRYDGKSDPLIFINDCESYFHQQRTMVEEKVWMASYNLEDVAQLWYMQLQEDEGTPRWGRFKDLLNLRFGPPLRAAPLFELAECRRSGTVEEYSNRFQALLPRTWRLDETQRVQLYTGGLLPPLSHAVRIHNPETLAAAMSLARQIELMESDRPTPTPARPAPCGLLPAPAPRPALTASPQPRALPAPPVGVPPTHSVGNLRRLAPKEQAERRRLGLYFNYNEKYSRGHNRFCRRIFFIDGVEIDDTDDAAARADNEAPCFSLQALAGVPLADTMQIVVTHGATSLVALLDSGSTHNFISEEATRRSGLPLRQRPRLTAMVANGERITCEGVIRDAPLLITGALFPTDLFVMPLAGYDVVLGTKWLRAWRPIVWDLARRRMSFQHEGHTVCWQGVPSPTAPRLQATVAVAADALLKSDASPVAVRPYRYPVTHKNELEWQCAAMIEQGIVHRSDSPFSSPVLLVKKPDGSWRFCVDYRALNALTVKDAFPIPVVDELHGARFFTKLDLRSGYHQVRMWPEDVHKTAFHTHDGLYEFLVMAFGLCNAPATFQALMNDFLRPFLRRFVLVFFDDILIYSKTWADHLRHLRAIFSELRHQQLFVKCTKCAFGAVSVAYLDHVISEASVAMDPTKVQAIHEWPAPRSARAVRGFLGLAGYYRKFVHNYGTITAPLTALLKKDGFEWSEATAAAFDALKTVVSSAPILTMPDFNKPFIIKCDASSHGFGAVLIQEGHPVAFFSRPVAPRHRALAAYERELIGLVQAVRNWRSYLWGRRFLVKTDHYSLKYLLD